MSSEHTILWTLRNIHFTNQNAWRDNMLRMTRNSHSIRDLLVYLFILIFAVTISLIFVQFEQLRILLIGGLVFIIWLALVLRDPYVGAVTLIASEWMSEFLDILGGVPINRWLGFVIFAILILRYIRKLRTEKLSLGTLDYALLSWALIHLLGFLVNGGNSAYYEPIRLATTGYLLFFIIVQTTKTENKLTIALFFIMGLGLANASVALYQLITEGVNYRLTGVSTNPNTLAEQCFYSLVLILTFGWHFIKNTYMRILIICLSICLTIVMIGTGSRSVFFAAVLAFCWFGIHFWRRITIKSFVLILITFVFGLALILPWIWERAPQAVERILQSSETATESTYINIQLTKRAINGFWDHPLLGIGPGNGISYLSEVSLLRGMRVHNLYANTLLEIGLLGFAILTIILISPFKKNAQIRRLSSSYKNKIVNVASNCLEGLLLAFILTISLVHASTLNRPIIVIIALLESARRISYDEHRKYKSTFSNT